MFSKKNRPVLVFDWDSYWEDAKNKIGYETILEKHRRGEYLVERSVLEKKNQEH